MEQTRLYVPVNIKIRYEFFDGYGIKELLPTIAAALVSGCVAFVLHTVTTGTIMPVLVVLITVAASVMALAKGENTMSVVDHLKCVLRFAREQRQYPYDYSDEWGDKI
jgi:hypothetical protein